jgi:hypothetical protein
MFDFAVLMGLGGVLMAALLIYLGSAHEAEAATEPSPFVPCQSCGTEVRKGREDCPACGHALRVLAVPGARPGDELFDWALYDDSRAA